MITTATLEILDQGLSVLEKLSDQDYDTPFTLVYGGTIGGHYRHVLEHFSTLLSSFDSGLVNYDLRNRNQSIEKQRGFAIDATLELRKQWENLSTEVYDKPMQLQGKISNQCEENMKIETSAGREVTYAIAHAHHHFAIIGVMCELLAQPIASEFGIAPSTLAHQRSKAIG